MTYRKSIFHALVAATAMVSVATVAQADEHYRGHEMARPAWHGEIHRFGFHDMEIWRGGTWFRGPHLGRAGWWWIVGGVWYWYPAPVYPFPDPYRPPVIVGPPPATPTWYFCQNPQGYYPYVSECFTAWQTVPAGTQPAPQPAPPPAQYAPPPAQYAPPPAQYAPPPAQYAPAPQAPAPQYAPQQTPPAGYPPQ